MKQQAKVAKTFSQTYNNNKNKPKNGENFDRKYFGATCTTHSQKLIRYSYPQTRRDGADVGL